MGTDWIKYGKTWEEFDDEFDGGVGFVVEMDQDPTLTKFNGIVTRLLVGNVNRHSGVCGCCCVPNNAIVIRYRRLITKEEMAT